MKKNDIVELNGTEYTVELNREAYVAIDKYSNLKKSLKDISKDLYNYVEDISPEENPFGDIPTLEEQIEDIEKKDNILKQLYIRAFWVWLYPNHKLSISEVEELLMNYLNNEAIDKFEYISEKYNKFMGDCIQISRKEEEELKNLKALAK